MPREAFPLRVLVSSRNGGRWWWQLRLRGLAMDAFFSGLDSRLRCSVKVADSIMMGLVNAAMEDAYKKSLWKDGDLERLFQKLRFAELAIMQLEWCLRFVRGEMETSGADDCHEQLLDDLLETRDRIQVRLDEDELAVADKDHEYMRRNHEEFASSRREAVPVDSGRASANRRGVEEGFLFVELKGSVDRQMARMRVRLEDARSTLTALMQKVSGEASPMARLQEAGLEGDGVKGLSGFYSMAQLLMEFQEMVLDAGAVRDSVASSFDVIETSVSSLREAMDEQQWLANAEKEIYGSVVDSFLQEINVGCSVLKDCSSSSGQPPTENVSEETEHLKGKTGQIPSSRPVTSGNEQYCYSAEHSISHDEVERLIEEKVDSDIRCELQHVLQTAMFGDLVREFAVLDVQKETEENDESDIRVELLCEIYTTLFEELVCKLGAESVEHFIRTCIKDEVEAVVVAETLNEWKSVSEMVRNDRHIKEENVSFEQPKKDFEQNINSNVLRCTDESTHSINLGRISIIKNIAQIHIMKMQTSGASEGKNVDSFQALLDKEIPRSSGNFDRQDSKEGDLRTETLIHKDNISGSVNDSIEQVLEQQEHTKLLTGDAVLKLSIPPEDVNIENGDMTRILNEKHDVIQSTDSNPMIVEQDQSELKNALVPLSDFQDMFMNFEAVTCEKIEAAMLRLRNLKKQQGNLVEQMSSLKRSEQIYQNAFTRRCHDLQTAEAEVDLLGDEVELLLGLLRKTYKALDQYSPILEHYLGIREMLKLLGKELAVRHQI
ncbi:hypothetical protein ABZP36_002769 [Zizania latifolia]